MLGGTRLAIVVILEVHGELFDNCSMLREKLDAGNPIENLRVND